MSTLLVTDLDGTLLNAQSQVPPQNSLALQAWVDSGRVLALATGRNYRITAPIAQAINRPMFLILQDGSLIWHYPSGEILSYHNLPLALAQQVHSLGRQAQQSFLFFDPLPDGHSFSLSQHGPLSEGLRRYLSYHQGEYHPAPDTLTLPPSKIVTLDDTALTQKLYVRLCLDFPQARILRTEAVRLGAWFVEIGPPQASKYLALQNLLAHLQISLADAVAIGDAENDLELIQFAGLGVAMGNASARVQAVADRVIGPHTDASLGHFVMRLLG